MKRGLRTQVCGLQQILLFTALMIAGLLPTVRSAWGQDDSPNPTQPTTPKAVPRADLNVTFAVDQISAQLRFLSVPTELVESTISDWNLAPFDQAQLAAANSFAEMNQPLERPRSSLQVIVENLANVDRPGLRKDRRKSEDFVDGRVTTGTERQFPSIHKILNDEEVELLVGTLLEDERTQTVMTPHLMFIDGITSSVVVGENKPFIVGWKNGAPQTRVVPKGKMIRIRTVLDGDQLWIDYEIIISRILDVTSRSIRVANYPGRINLSVPNVETTKASATVKLPVGGTVLIGGLPTESQDGVPHQLLVLLRADRVRGFQSRKAAQSDTPKTQGKLGVDLQEPPRLKLAIMQHVVAEEKRSRFSLISRFFNRNSKQSSNSVDAGSP